MEQVDINIRIIRILKIVLFINVILGVLFICNLFIIGEIFDKITNADFSHDGSMNHTAFDNGLRYNVNIKSEEIIGDTNALVTMIVFSDYGCTFCQKFIREQLPLLEKEYINTHKIKLIIRNIPNPENEKLFNTAVEGECAREQGKFLEFTKFIIDTQEGPYLKILSKKHGIDTTKLNSCIKKGTKQSLILNYIEDAKSAGITATPTFIINGRLYRGIMPIGMVKEIIETLLHQLPNKNVKTHS